LGGVLSEHVLVLVSIGWSVVACNMSEGRLFVARVARDVRARDLEDLFGRFGRLRDVVVKVGYAFVEFDDARDARDAYKDLDGYKLLGERIVIEYSRRPPGDPGRRGGRSRSRSPAARRPSSRFSPPRNTEHRMRVKNLPPRTGWQDLKDFFRDGGRVCFADVRRDHDGAEVGIVEFESAEDLERALTRLQGQKLHGSELQLIKDAPGTSAPSGGGAAGGGGGGGGDRARRSRSRSRSPRRRSRSRTPPRGRSPVARARSGSPAARPNAAPADSHAAPQADAHKD